MPVNRKREHVQPQYRTTPTDASGVTRAALAVTDAINEPVRLMSDMAANFARSMAATSQEEATRLAAAAVLSQDENGVPQLPEETWSHMGRIARRTYDSHMQDKLVRGIETAWTAQEADAAQEAGDDRDLYNRLIEEKATTFRQSLPEVAQGAFQQFYNGAAVQRNAEIGFRNAKKQREDDAQALVLSTDSVIQSATGLYVSGQAEEANAMLAGLVQEIRADTTLSYNQKRQAEDKLVTNWAQKRIWVDAGWNETPPTATHLRALAEDLNQGIVPEELAKYFDVPGTGENRDWLAPSATQLANMLLASADQRERAIRTMTDARTDVTAAKTGTKFTPNDANVAAYETEVGNAAGIGGPMTADAWIALGAGVTDDGVIPDDLANAIRETKSIARGGHLPPSLNAAFQQAFAAKDVGQARALIGVYRALTAQHSDATGVNFEDLTGLIAHKPTADWFMRINALTDHNTPFAEAVFSANDWADPDRQTTIRGNITRSLQDGFDSASWYKNAPDDLNETNYDKYRNDFIRQYYIEKLNRTPHPDEMTKGAVLFDAYLASSHTAQDAIRLMRTELQQDYVETETGGTRSDDGLWFSGEGANWTVPASESMEAAYPQVMATDFTDMLFEREALEGEFQTKDGKVPRADVSNFLGATGEALIQGIMMPVNIIAGEDLLDENLGVELGRHSMLESYIHTQIRNDMDAGIIDPDPDKVLNEVFHIETTLVPGRHYRTSLDKAASQKAGRKIFNVHMKGQNDQWVPVVTETGHRYELHPYKVFDAYKQYDKLLEYHRASRNEKWTPSTIANDPGGYINDLADAAEEYNNGEYNDVADYLRTWAKGADWVRGR